MSQMVVLTLTHVRLLEWSLEAPLTRLELRGVASTHPPCGLGEHSMGTTHPLPLAHPHSLGCTF